MLLHPRVKHPYKNKHFPTGGEDLEIRHTSGDRMYSYSNLLNFRMTGGKARFIPGVVLPFNSRMIGL
jgi:hypothetical protein